MHKFFFFLLLFTGTSLFAQNTTNIQVSTTDDQLLVSYDLEGKKDMIYLVNLRMKLNNGDIIQPKSVKGDIGNVLAGKGKAIVWDVYKDRDQLNGNIEPILEVTEQKAPRTPKAEPQPTPTPPQPKPPVVDIDQQKKRDARKKNIRKGFKVGLGNSRVDANRPSYQQQFSYEVGTYLRWQARKRLYLQPEVLYHLQAYENLINNTENTITRHHFVRGQVLGGVAPFGFGLYFNGGIYYGYLLGGSERQNLNSGSQTINLTNVAPMNGVDIPFERHDLGYIIGGSFSLFKGSFALGALWSNSFNNSVNPAYYVGDADNENLNLRNQSYHFFIQKRF